MKSTPATAILLAVMMTVSFPTALGAGGDGRDAPMEVTVRAEWASETFNGTPEILLNDTDRDGVQELIAWGNFNGEGKIRVYDFPGYFTSWAVNYTTEINLRLVDINDNGSIQFIIDRTDYESHNFTIVNARTFATMWVGPNFFGSIQCEEIIDVDADGVREFVWLNQSMTGSRPDVTYDTRYQIYSTANFQKEWESPNIGYSADSFKTGNIDADAAREIVFDGQNNTGNGTLHTPMAYDGATHSLQWSKEQDKNVTSFEIVYLGDVDADTQGEVVFRFDDLNDSFGHRTGFSFFNGSDGALEWNFTFGNSSVGQELTDIDNDGALELLCSGEMGEKDFFNKTNITHHVYDLKNRTRAWSAGPFEEGMMDSSSLVAQDVTGDGVPELVLTNSTFDMMTYNSRLNFTVFDSRTFATRWTSPDFSGFGGMLNCGPLDSDTPWEAVVADSWTDATGNPHGIIHQYQTDNFNEEWNSGDLGAMAFAAPMQAVNDSRPELMLMVQVPDNVNMTSNTELRILDSNTHCQLWKSPQCQNSDLGFIDLMGSSRNEIFFAVINDSWDANLSYRISKTTMLLYNDTTFGQRWQSPEISGRLDYLDGGDIDNDTTKELLGTIEWTDENWNTFVNITAWEVTEGPRKMADLSIVPADLVLSNSTPVVGMPLELTATLRNTGNAPANACCVTFAVDGAQGATRTVNVSELNSTRIVFPWLAVLGTHTLTIKADPRNTIFELDETNNEANITVTVSPRPRPVALISSPAEMSQLEEGKNITFNGSGSTAPPGSNLTYFWVDELLGPIGTGPLVITTMAAGAHLVTLYVDDTYFNVSATVNFTVNPAPPPPGSAWAFISSPRNGGSYTAGEMINFDGSRSVPSKSEYTLSYEWSSNLTGPTGSAGKFSMAITAGDHNITLKVDDGHGGAAQASVTIRVKPFEGVVALMSSPLEGKVYQTTETITFDGSNSTGPSGAVLTFLWSANTVGPLSSQNAFSRKMPEGNHAISMSVNDGIGHVANASVNIIVRKPANAAPVLTLDTPLEGGIAIDNITIRGTAWDDVRVSTVFIRIDNLTPFSVLGSANWSYLWNTRLVANGTHRITVWGTDGVLLSQEVVVNFTVANPPVKPKPPVKPVDNSGTRTVLIAGVAVAVLAAIGAGAFLMMRRKGPSGGVSGTKQPRSTDASGPAPPKM